MTSKILHIGIPHINLTQTFAACRGISAGFRAGNYFKYIKEIEQGKNYTLSSINKIGLVFQTCITLHKINTATYQSKVFSYGALPLLAFSSIFLLPLAGVVRDGNYKAAASLLNTFLLLHVNAPRGTKFIQEQMALYNKLEKGSRFQTFPEFLLKKIQEHIKENGLSGWATSIIKTLVAQAGNKDHKSDAEWINFLKGELTSSNAKYRKYSLILDKLPDQIPSEISSKKMRILEYISKHTEKVMLTSLVCSSVALITLKPEAKDNLATELTGMLFTLGYKFLDTQGALPVSASLFIEQNIAPFLRVAELFGKSKLDAFFAFIEIASFTGLFGKPLLIGLDATILPENNPTPLSKVFRNFQLPRLTASQVESILLDPDAVELNIPHLSYSSFTKESNLTPDTNFQDLQNHYESINWRAKSEFPVVLAKVLSDDRFHDYMKTFFPDTAKEEIRSKTRLYLSKLVKEEQALHLITIWLKEYSSENAGYSSDAFSKEYKNLEEKYQYIMSEKTRLFELLQADNDFKRFLQEKGFSHENLAATLEDKVEETSESNKLLVEEFIFQWFQEQYKRLVEGLLEKKQVVGNASDLRDAQDNCSYILAKLNDKLAPLSRIEKNDTLIKLAVEAGEYCARGIKRASNEVLEQIIYTNSEDADPISTWRNRISRNLYQKRQLIVEEYYDAVTKPLLASANQDVHIMDLYRLNLSIGFVPLTKNDQKAIGLGNFLGLRTYDVFRKEMLNIYKDYLDTATHTQGSNRSNGFITQNGGVIQMTQYLRDWINAEFKDDEKEKLSKVVSDFELEDENGITEKLTNADFARLALATLGVYKLKDKKKN